VKNLDCSWDIIRFGLFVTGEGERQFLPDLFRILQKSGLCDFEIVAKIEQVRPRGAKRQQELRLAGKKIPDKDAEIGLRARRYLQQKSNSYILVIDDLEKSGRDAVSDIFQRYRDALDTILIDLKDRASVHFFVNMLEAYYFADSRAINTVMQLNPPLLDHPGDVEEIDHPKSELKHLLRSNYHIYFDEVEHGKQIVPDLNIEHILSKPDYCKSLRTIFVWCIEKLRRHSGYGYTSLPKIREQIQGQVFSVTQGQFND